MADALLRFFFRPHFTRADTLVIVPVVALLVTGTIGLIAAIALTFGGFFVTGFGDYLLARREGRHA